MAFNPKGNLGFAGSSLDGKGEVHCFEIDSGKQMWTKIFDHSPIYAVCASPNGEEIAVGGYDGKIRLLSIASGELKRELSIAPIQKSLAQNNKILLNKPFEMTALQDDETIPVNLEVNGLSILPQNISLTSPLDYAQILVRADLGKGRVLDVTRMVTWSIPDELCSIDNRGLLTPAKDGKGEIKATLGKHDVSLSFSFCWNKQSL